MLSVEGVFRTIFSDNLNLHIAGFATMQHTHLWGTENLRYILQHELNRRTWNSLLFWTG